MKPSPLDGRRRMARGRLGRCWLLRRSMTGWGRSTKRRTRSEERPISRNRSPRVPRKEFSPFAPRPASSCAMAGERQEWTKPDRPLRRRSVVSSLPLADECRVVLAAGEASGVIGAIPTLKGISRLAGALEARGNARWRSAALLIAAQTHSRLGFRQKARHNLEEALAIAREEGFVGMPLGLPVDQDALLRLAVQEGIAPDQLPRLLGIGQATGRKALSALLEDKSEAVRMRAKVAEAALHSVERPPVRFVWPGTSPDPDAPVHHVSLRGLGSFAARIDDSAADWPSDDAMELAAYLVVRRGQEISWEQLTADVWPGLEPSIANTRLQVALYRLREELGAGYPPVNPDLEWRGVYRWDGEGCSLDVDAFLEEMRKVHESWEGERPPVLSPQIVVHLESAAELYEGEFMAGLGFPWCFPLRDELRSQLLWASRVLLNHHVASRNWQQAARYGLKYLGSDPLQEDVVRDVMLSYYHLGNKDAVLHQYTEIKRLLAKEKGEWPTEETRQLRVRLLGK